MVIVHFQDLLNNNYTQNIEIEVVNIKEITAITIFEVSKIYFCKNYIRINSIHHHENND